MAAEKKKGLPGWAKIVILLLVLAAALGAYAGLRAYNSSRAEKEDAASSTSMLSVNQADVTSFSYTLDGAVYTYERKDSKSDWIYQQDPDLKLTQDAVTDMLKRACSVSTEDVVSKDQNKKSDFGLDNPRMTITLGLKDGSQKIIYVGGLNSMTSEYYANVEGDARIFTVDTDFYSSFTGAGNLAETSSGGSSSSVE